MPSYMLGNCKYAGNHKTIKKPGLPTNYLGIAVAGYITEFPSRHDNLLGASGLGETVAVCVLLLAGGEGLHISWA